MSSKKMKSHLCSFNLEYNLLHLLKFRQKLSGLQYESTSEYSRVSELDTLNFICRHINKLSEPDRKDTVRIWL